MNLDTVFIAQIITIIGFAVGASILLASMKYPRHIRQSLHFYAYGKFLMGGGFLIAAFRGAVAPEILIPLANGVAVAGLSLNYVSIRRLQGKSAPRFMSLLAGVGVAAACGIALMVGPVDLTASRLLSSIAASALLSLIAIELLVFHDRRGVAHYSLGAVTMLLATAFMIRVGAALTQPPVPIDEMSDDMVERITFILIFLGTVIGAINFTLMASDEFNKELTLLAHTDGLTGVLNRRRFLELGALEFRRAKRYGRSLTVLIIDIDRFKTINDRAGHPFGDRVIRAVADSCTAHLREEDAIGRMGGEEFAILLPETAAIAGAQTAERLRTAIERDTAALTAECGLLVTCSVGGVTLDPGHDSFDDLIAQSDTALYLAKNAGRNRVSFADRTACAVASA